jgi:hypothetical protein
MKDLIGCSSWSSLLPTATDLQSAVVSHLHDSAVQRTEPKRAELHVASWCHSPTDHIPTSRKQRPSGVISHWSLCLVWNVSLVLCVCNHRETAVSASALASNIPTPKNLALLFLCLQRIDMRICLSTGWCRVDPGRAETS